MSKLICIALLIQIILSAFGLAAEAGSMVIQIMLSTLGLVTEVKSAGGVPKLLAEPAGAGALLNKALVKATVTMVTLRRNTKL